MITLKIRYLLIAAALFAIEVAIAQLVHGGFVRLYLGDYLVVILLYCGVRAFTTVSISRAATGVLIFAFAVEISQYLDLIHHLGLESSRAAHLILGSLFDWKDLVAYTTGIATVLGAEYAARLTPRRS